MDNDMTEAIALHRWAVIAEATADRLNPAERGVVVRAIAGAGPRPSRRQRAPLQPGHDRPLDPGLARQAASRRCGPRRRADTGAVRAHPELVAEAAALRLELPTRSAAQIASILLHRHGVARRRAHRARTSCAGGACTARRWRPSRRCSAATRRPGPTSGGSPTCWSGPWVPHPKVDVLGAGQAVPDRRRPLPAAGRRPCSSPTRTPGPARSCCAGPSCAGGCPRSSMPTTGRRSSNAWLARTCAVLGVRLVHSKPYSPEGRGKQERLNRYIREAFLAEATHPASTRSRSSTTCFVAWAEQVANRRIHAETERDPDRTLRAGGPAPRGRPRAAARGVPLVGHPQGDPHRHRVARGQRLRGRPRPRRPAGRAALRPRGPARHRRVLSKASPAGVATPFVIGRHTHRAVPQAARPDPDADRRRLPGHGGRRPRGAGRHREPRSTSPSWPCSTTPSDETRRPSEPRRRGWPTSGSTAPRSASRSPPRTSSPAPPTPRPWPASTSAWSSPPSA